MILSRINEIVERIPVKQEYLCLGMLGVILVLLIIEILDERRKLFTIRIEKGSRKLKALKKLNSRCQFYQTVKPQYEEYIQLKNKQQYDQFDFERYMKDTMQRCFISNEQIISQIQYNQKQMQRYESELNMLPDYMNSEDAKKCKVPYYFCKKKEIELYKENIQSAVIAPDFTCIACYTSPKGRNSYRKESRYTYDQFVQMHMDAKKEIQWRQTRQGNAEYERSRMNNSIRYDILKRDHFRCVLCGRSAEDGVKLHVDHIIPVSKGGKTEYLNLRTLCDACNLGKKDKYDVNGWN